MNKIGLFIMGFFLSFIFLGIFIGSNSGIPTATPPNTTPETPTPTPIPSPPATIPQLTEDEFWQDVAQFERLSKTVTVAELDKDPNSYLSKYIYNSKDDSGVIRISFQCFVSGFPKDNNGNPLIQCSDLNDWITSWLLISPGRLGVLDVDVTKVNYGDRVKVLGAIDEIRWLTNNAGQKLYIPIVSQSFFIDLTNGYHNK